MDTRVPTSGVLTLLAVAVSLSCGEPQYVGSGGMFRGGPRHQGVYAAAAADGRGLIEWSFATGGPVRGSALADSERVYIGSGDGNFYAVDRVTGAERWRFRAGHPIHSSAATRGELVYFVDRSNIFYALERRTGRLRWRVELGEDRPWEWGHEGWDYFTSSPAFADGLVIVGSGSGGIFAFDAVTGAERWRVETGGRVRSSPAVGEGVVYVGSADGFLYAIDLSDGSVMWRFETEGALNQSSEFGFDRKTIQSSPALAGGAVFFGSRDGKFYAVDASSGELVWRYDHTTPWVVASPAIYDGSVIVGTSDGFYVHSLDAQSGEEAWRFEVGHRTFSSPAVSGGAVYVGTHSNRFLSLDAETGGLRWELRFTEAINSSPVVYEGVVYIGCDDGSLYAIRLVDGPPPRRAVYWDADRLDYNTFAGHEGVRDYLQGRGYEVLDQFQLAVFMESSNETDAASVIVFAMDDLPPTVAPVAADTVLARRYLAGGGKIVWLGLPPLIVERDADGNFLAVDRERPGALLGVDFELYDVDEHASYVTPDGQRWGFRDWWIGASGIDPAGVTTVLAVDERTAASAWVKGYGGPAGSGFVFLWGTYRPLSARHYEQVRRVAEQGIGIVRSEPVAAPLD